MAAEYDNLLKYLAENHAASLASWLLGRPVGDRVRLLKTELSLQPVRADFLATFDLEDEILQIEFETDPTQSEPPLPLRMLDYFVRTYRRERKPVRQVVIVLAETNAHIPDEFHVGDTWHRYRVILMCEQDPEALLAHDGLLPLALLARSPQPEALLREVADRVQNIPEPGLRSDLTAAAFMLGGLRFDQTLLRSLFKEEIMIQSSTYRDLVERSEARGIRLGKLDLLQEQLFYKFGVLPEAVKRAIADLNPDSLTHLSKALLEFKSVDDLHAWLKENQQTTVGV
ncbi:MAG: Rpn family recombination-promoting nuclease/putative transposase [Blastocatellia bacterium]